MENVTTPPIIHSYDPERRRVLCGVTEQTHSTKHAAGVTCERCRQLLRAERDAEAEAELPDVPLGSSAAAAHGP